MTTVRFPTLFSPLQVGPLTVKNRIVNSAHQPRFASDGHYTARYIAYQRERARGGAAIVVSQATSVNPDYLDLKNYDDSIVDEYGRIAEAVHEFGARYFAELYHPGRQSEYTGFGADIYHAPSPVPLESFGREMRIPHELTGREIRAVIDSFAAAAARCRKGGIDGVELHLAHGNLAQQFMSPLTNQRADEWGGSLENRLRFTREVATAVREAAGPGMVVGCRITGAELEPGGLSQLDMLEIAGTIDGWGLLDYFSVTMGHYSDLINTARNMPDMSFKPGLWAEYGRSMKHVVAVPVFLVGRINHPALAEELLATGCCDMVVMARGLIADPEFPRKAEEGRVEDIRPCVGAMTCIHRHERGLPVACIYNPAAGRELEWGGDLPRAAVSKNVVVVGGGPGGLEAARVAARRGHHVTLLEKEAALGGQLRLAMRAPGRQDLGQITEWLRAQCEAADVDIRLETEATPELLEKLAPDVVVVATGAAPVPDGGAHDAWAVLAGEAVEGERVLVVDPAGDRVGFSVAQQLAEAGKEVVVAGSTIFPGSQIDSIGWRRTIEQLGNLGVTFRPLAEVGHREGRSVHLRDVFTRREVAVEAVDAVVQVNLPAARDSLFHALSERFPDVRLVGDARAPRSVEAAVYEGQEVGRAI